MGGGTIRGTHVKLEIGKKVKVWILSSRHHHRIMYFIWECEDELCDDNLMEFNYFSTGYILVMSDDWLMIDLVANNKKF